MGSEYDDYDEVRQFKFVLEWTGFKHINIFPVFDGLSGKPIISTSTMPAKSLLYRIRSMLC